MSLKQLGLRALAALALAHAALLTPQLAQAQNSREAIEAVRKHRAEQDRAERGSPRPATDNAPAPQRASSPREQPFRSSADPTADPRASLKSCMDHSGMNMAARDRCMRQHCEGRWGQGDCPAQGGDLVTRQGANSRTPLGRCLAEAGANPFRRDACGWRHCNKRWDAPECAALQPNRTPSAN